MIPNRQVQHYITVKQLPALLKGIITKNHGGAAHTKCNLKHSAPEEITIDFYNVSNYGYHFILKDLAVAFEKQFTSLGENTEKYITFFSPNKKESYKN